MDAPRRWFSGRRRRSIEAWGRQACGVPGRMRIAGPADQLLGKAVGLFAGIDTHKDTLAVAVIDGTGRRRASEQLPNSEPGFLQLVKLLEAHQVVRVGIEGSGNFGRAIAVHLALDWVPDRDVAVVEVPTLMTSRERRAQVGRGKTDPVDALAIARITARETGLPPVRLTIGPAADLRALLDYGDDLMAERTALANRVHAELTGLAPGYQQQIRSLTSRTASGPPSSWSLTTRGSGRSCAGVGSSGCWRSTPRRRR